ncbi:MAG TPA: hypothetical protein VFN38_02135, partial [Gemmatimonadaceae bacterium]|nr:hypothetical protein [Gemmatimonadaceae bacterium]
PTLRRDEAFETALRMRERAIAPALFAPARAWYRSEHVAGELPQGVRYSVSAVPIASPDGDTWFRLVNNAAVGFENVQQVFGVDPSVAVGDWSASHAVDDVSTLIADQFKQKSWNWHSLYGALCSAGTGCPYPLPVRTMVAGTTYTGTVRPGGSTHFKLAVAAGGTATVTLNSASANASSLRLLIVRTK